MGVAVHVFQIADTADAASALLCPRSVGRFDADALFLRQSLRRSLEQAVCKRLISSAALAGVPEVGAALIAAGAVERIVEIALVSDSPDLLHRAAVALERFFELNLDLMIGAEGSEPPSHALTALGALVMLAKSGVEPVKKSALTAIVQLSKTRPNVKLPPTDAVALIVEKLKEDHARRLAESDAAEEAGEVDDEGGGEEGGAIIEEVEVQTEVGTEV